MKIFVIIISQSRLFLHFCVRILCCQLFLVSTLVCSETYFSDSDSTLYISEGTLVYAGPKTIVYVTNPVDEQSSASLPPVFYKGKTLQSTSKPSSKATCRAGHREDSLRFAAPVGSQQIGSTGSLSSQAVTGDYFSRKLFRQIISFGLLNPKGIIPHQKRIYGITSYHFKVIKINIQQYSRPPPLI